MIKTWSFPFNIKGVNNVPHIELVEGDYNSYQFDISLTDGLSAIPLIDQTVRLVLKKSDSKLVWKDFTIVDAIRGKVTILLSNQAVVALGNVEAQIKIYGLNFELITSTEFVIEVTGDLLDDNEVLSSNEFASLTTVLSDITQAKEDVGIIGTLHTQIQEDITTGDELDVILKDDISSGDTLKTSLELNISSGNILDVSLKDGIDTGNILDIELKEDISSGSVLDESLKGGITTGNELDTTLKASTVAGNTTDTNVKASTVLGNATDGALKADTILAKGAMYAAEVTEARKGEVDLGTKIGKLDESLADNVMETKVMAQETKIREIMIKHIFKSREQLIASNNPKKVLLLGYPTARLDVRSKTAYAQCERMLLHSRIPFDESTLDLTPTINKVTDYSCILIPYALVGDMTAQPSYFDGTLGIPIIVASGGSGWHSYPASTCVSGIQSDGNHLFKLPNGDDFYSEPSERFNIATLTNLEKVDRVIYDPIDVAKAFVWIVTGVSNKTLYCSNYNTSMVGPWVLYYMKLWGDYPNALPLPLCLDLDDANQQTLGFEVDISGLQKLYDWAKSVKALVTTGIKTDQIDSPYNQYPSGTPTEQTSFCLEHQDIFIPIIHDHNFNPMGGTQTKYEIQNNYEARLQIARQYGFAIPYDMWGYLFQPLNVYNDSAIELWKEIGIVATRDTGSGTGVYASDGTTIISEIDREAMSEPDIVWVNANQFVPAESHSIAETLAIYGFTDSEWRGFVCQKWLQNICGGFSNSLYKDNSRVHQPSFSVIYGHGNNLNGDSPYLEGLKLGDNIRKAFPDTVYYTHPSTVINRSNITKLSGRY